MLILLFSLFGLGPPLPQQQAAAPARRVHEVQANVYTEDRQEDAAVAADRHGNLLVVWTSRRQEQGTAGIFGQLFDPLGRPLGPELRVNHFLPENQSEPAVAFAPDGSAWVAWSSEMQDGDGFGVYARRLAWEEGGAAAAPQFRPQGGEIQVSQSRRGRQADPTLEIDQHGVVLVAWADWGEENQARIMARSFEAGGAPRSDEFVVAEAAPGQPGAPVLAPLAGARFVAAWGAYRQDAGAYAIHGRLLGPRGPLGEIFSISGELAGDHVEPSLASDGAERFVAAWMSREKGSAYAVSVRRFAAAAGGEVWPGGPVVEVEAGGAGYRSGAAVAMRRDGSFVVAYNATAGKSAAGPGRRPERATDVRAWCYDAAGRPWGSPFAGHAVTGGEQTLQVGWNARHLLWTELDQVVVAWHGDTGTDRRGVGLTIHAPPSLDLPAPPVEPRVAALVEAAAGPGAAPRTTVQPDPDPAGPLAAWPAGLPPRAGTFGFDAFSNTGWIPPDCNLAVGPQHVVATVNVDLKFFNKSGTTLFSGGLESFFNASGFVFDPVAVFDPHSQRYIVAAAEHDAAGADGIDLAVSDDADPNGAWHKYRFDFSAFCDFLDFPNLGVGADAVYMTADCFNLGGNFIHVFPKAPLLNGQPVTPITINTSPGAISLGCVKNYDPGSSVQYFATTYSGCANDCVRFYALTDPLGSPQLHTVTVPVKVFRFPPDADQKGSSNKADTVDFRIKHGVYRNGRLWLAHNVGAGGLFQPTARVRWYEFDMRGWPLSGASPLEVQSGTLNYGTYEHNWFGDIHVDDAGNAVIAYNHSSPNHYIGVEYVKRMAGDPLGVMGPRVELQRGVSPETSNRWGDYSGVEEDPAQPGTFWSHHEYHAGSWRTWIGKFQTQERLTLTQTALIRGFPVTFTVSDAQPGELVHFLYSAAGSGAGPCPPALGGLCLDLLAPVHSSGSAVAGATGAASLYTTVPRSAPQVPIWSQAVVQRGLGGVSSVESNVTVETIY